MPNSGIEGPPVRTWRARTSSVQEIFRAGQNVRAIRIGTPLTALRVHQAARGLVSAQAHQNSNNSSVDTAAAYLTFQTFWKTPQCPGATTTRFCVTGARGQGSRTFGCTNITKFGTAAADGFSQYFCATNAISQRPPTAF
jgi:hypothetical protein